MRAKISRSLFRHFVILAPSIKINFMKRHGVDEDNTALLCVLSGSTQNLGCRTGFSKTLFNPVCPVTDNSTQLGNLNI